MLILLLLLAVTVEALHGIEIGKNDDQPHLLAPTLDITGVSSSDDCADWLPVPFLAALPPAIWEVFTTLEIFPATGPPEAGRRPGVQKSRLHRLMSVELI